MTDPNTDPQVRAERVIHDLSNLALDLHALLADPETERFVIMDWPENTLWLLHQLDVSVKQKRKLVA